LELLSNFGLAPQKSAPQCIRRASAQTTATNHSNMTPIVNLLLLALAMLNEFLFKIVRNPNSDQVESNPPQHGAIPTTIDNTSHCQTYVLYNLHTNQSSRIGATHVDCRGRADKIITPVLVD